MNGATLGTVVATLRPLLRRTTAAHAGGRCEICAGELHVEHRHVVDTHARRILCACAACGLLDDTAASAPTRYRAVSTRYEAGPALEGSIWEPLGIPVDLAFVFYNSALQRIVAAYPGAAGAVESLLPLDAWTSLADAYPWLRSLVPDVEAVLVRKEEGRYHLFIVPIDACYELAGRVRSAWSGMSGGEALKVEVDRFFADIRQRSRPAPARGTTP